MANACFCCLSGRLRHARAMTTALSPESRMLMTQIWNRATQISGLVSISVTRALLAGGNRSDHVRKTRLPGRCAPLMARLPRNYSGLPAGLHVACRGITGMQGFAGVLDRLVVRGKCDDEGIADAVDVVHQPDLRLVQRGDVAHDRQAEAAA